MYDTRVFLVVCYGFFSGFLPVRCCILRISMPQKKAPPAILRRIYFVSLSRQEHQTRQETARPKKAQRRGDADKQRWGERWTRTERLRWSSFISSASYYVSQQPAFCSALKPRTKLLMLPLRTQCILQSGTTSTTGKSVVYMKTLFRQEV